MVGLRRVAVEVDGDAQLRRRAPAELVGEGHAVVHRHARDRHERDDVHRAHAGVLALLRPHVDPLPGHSRRREGALDDGLGRADERVDGPVRGGAGVHVEQRAPGRRADRVGDRVDHGPVAALREVRHALDELPHGHPCCRPQVWPPPRTGQAGGQISNLESQGRIQDSRSDPIIGAMRKILRLACLLLLARAAGAAPPPPAAEPFPLRDVRILDGPFREAQQRDLAYLLSLDPDRLLHTFRLNAGLPTTAKPYGGWEAPERRAARTQPRPLPDRLRPDVRGDGRRAAEGPGARDRRRAAEGPAGPPREGHDAGLPLGLPRGVLRPRRGATRASGRPTTPSTRSWPASSTSTGRPATRRRSRP